MVKSQDHEQRQQGRLNMGSSNKNWTEMFKNKSSSGRKSATFPSVVVDGSEERTPGPKPRWNPRPEQIQILNAIFNSGMVNPPREEISKIRAQLQEFGQVADVNVYYWFQNRKSRSKLKNRQQYSAARSATSRQPLLAHSSSSASSERHSPNGVRSGGFLDLSKNSSGGSVNQNHRIPNNQNNQYMNLQANQVQAPPPTYYPTQQIGAITTGASGGGQTPSQRFNEIMGGGGGGAIGSSQIESFSRLVLGDQITDGKSSGAVVTGPRRSVFEDEVQQMLSFMNTDPNTTTQTIDVPPPPATNFQMPSTSQIQGGARMVGPPRSTATVHINGVEVEVSAIHPFYVQEAFGEDAVLFYQSGHPVPTNNWGATLHPLQHGASYILTYFPSAATPN